MRVRLEKTLDYEILGATRIHRGYTQAQRWRLVLGDGSTVFHQALDYTQRNRLNSDWKAPMPSVLRARRANYDPLVREIAAGQGVDPHLVHALIDASNQANDDEDKSHGLRFRKPAPSA